MVHEPCIAGFGSLRGRFWWESHAVRRGSQHGVGKRQPAQPNLQAYEAWSEPQPYTISIENEGYNLANAPETQMKTLYELIKDVAGRYNIPIDRDHIIGHFEVDGVNRPFCPSPDHAIMERVVNSLSDDLVCVMCPRSRVELIQGIINNLK